MTLNLLDIVGMDKLQQLQDDFAAAANVSSIILDVDGTPITKASGFTPFCIMLMDNPVLSQNCIVSHFNLGARACDSHGLEQLSCPNLNLLSASAPVILDGKPIANWVMGQRITERRPRNEVDALAAKGGIDPDVLYAAYDQVPLLSESDFNRALKLLSLFANNLSEVCYINYQLQQSNKEKEQLIANMQTIIAKSDVVLYVCDPKTYELVYVSDYLRDSFGLASLDGVKCYRALQGRDEPCDFCPHKKLFDADGNPSEKAYRWEFHNPITDKEYFITDRVIPWHDGRLLHMEIGIDITDRKALAVADMVNAAQRDFLARMSHEIRTPMNGVLGMVHLALKSDSPAKQRDYLNKIQSSASILLGVINDILDFSKAEAGKLNIAELSFSLRELVRGVHDIMLPRIREKSLKFQIVIAKDFPDKLVGDSLRISQVFMNLVGNAVKFTNNGVIRLAVRAGGEAPGNGAVLPSGSGGGAASVEETGAKKAEGPSDAVDVGSTGDDGRSVVLHCEVRDTGIGMTQEQQERLFKPFAQADASISNHFGGTGLGLAISKAMVEAMGGKIWLESKEGEGSCFSFTLRLRRAENAPVAAPEKVALENSPLQVSGKKILLVEDNEINQEIATELLAGFGAEVRVASDGIKAVAAVEEGSYDLVLMDIHMPRMNGLEATAKIRSGSRPGLADLPIVGMTAESMPGTQAECLNSGMNDYITKPVSLKDLEAMLRKWL